MQHKSVNVPEVRKLVKQQFLLNANVTDALKISELKNKALNALTNYVMFLSQKYVVDAIMFFIYCLILCLNSKGGFGKS